MIYKILLTILILVLSTPVYTEPQTYSWGTTKKHLRTIILNKPHPVTLYGGCAITRNYRVDLASCNFYYALSNTKYETPGLGYIDAEHMVPASRLMVHARCLSTSRTVCRKYNPEFKRCHNTIANLLPAISVINRFRGNLPYGEIPNNEAWYPFGVDIGLKKNLIGSMIEPPNRSKPSIAYAYLYMNSINCIDLSFNEALMYSRWYSNY